MNLCLIISSSLGEIRLPIHSSSQVHIHEITLVLALTLKLAVNLV